MAGAVILYCRCVKDSDDKNHLSLLCRMIGDGVKKTEMSTVPTLTHDVKKDNRNTSLLFPSGVINQHFQRVSHRMNIIYIGPSDIVLNLPSHVKNIVL